MKLWNIADIAPGSGVDAAVYTEFLRVPSMSAGVYRLPLGGIDPQRPHSEDEVYLVVSGRAQIRVGDEDAAVGPGTAVFVNAGVDHRFHSIVEDLVVLVLFAPAEDSLQTE